MASKSSNSEAALPEEDMEEYMDDVYSIDEVEMGVTIVRNVEYLCIGR